MASASIRTAEYLWLWHEGENFFYRLPAGSGGHWIVISFIVAYWRIVKPQIMNLFCREDRVQTNFQYIQNLRLIFTKKADMNTT